MCEIDCMNNMQIPIQHRQNSGLRLYTNKMRDISRAGISIQMEGSILTEENFLGATPRKMEESNHGGGYWWHSFSRDNISILMEESSQWEGYLWNNLSRAAISNRVGDTSQGEGYWWEGLRKGKLSILLEGTNSREDIGQKDGGVDDSCLPMSTSWKKILSCSWLISPQIYIRS